MFAMGLVHAGAQGAGGGTLIVPDMGLGASNYHADELDPTGPVTIATIRFTLHRNGSWSVEKIGGFGGISGSPLTGSWGSPNQATAGDDFEGLLSVNSGSGGSVVNQCSVYTRLNGDKYIELSISDSDSGPSAQTGSRNITATVRKIGTTTPISTDTFVLQVTANWDIS